MKNTLEEFEDYELLKHIYSCLKDVRNELTGDSVVRASYLLGFIACAVDKRIDEMEAACEEKEDGDEEEEGEDYEDEDG